MAIFTPSAELVDAYLREIAKGYNVEWTLPNPNPTTTEKTSNDDDDGPDGGVKVTNPFTMHYKFQISFTGSHRHSVCHPSSLSKEPSKDSKTLEEPTPVDANTIAAEARRAGVRTPKLPDIPPTESEKSPPPEKPAPKATAPPTPPEDDFEALAKRFAALKKR